MGDQSILSILHSALLLEKKGEVFYRKVGEQAANPEVKSFFLSMAEEEVAHVAIIKKQIELYKESKQIDAKVAKSDIEGVADHVINPNLKNLIEGASYEAAAVSAAIDMENRAVKFYSDRANSATNEEEVELYKWLSTWEQSHLDDLVELDEAIREKYWFDNGFSPM